MTKKEALRRARMRLVIEFENMLGCSLHEWARLAVMNNFWSPHIHPRNDA